MNSIVPHRLRRHPKPDTWDEAAAIIVAEIQFTEGWQLSSLTNEYMVKLHDEGHWATMARAAMSEIGHCGQTIVDVLVSKQHDYGTQNILKYGLRGLEIRLWDKIARYQNLMSRSSGDVLNESLQDTCLDIVGYVTIAIMLELGWFELPLRGDLLPPPHPDSVPYPLFEPHSHETEIPALEEI